MKEKFPKIIETMINNTPYYSTITNSIPYNKQIVIPKLDGFVEEIYPELKIPGKNKYVNKRKKALNCIISQVIKADIHDKSVAFSRRRDEYTWPREYGLSYHSYAFIVKGVDALISEGYLNYYQGKYEIPSERGINSRIWMKEKLRKAVTDYRVNNYETDMKDEMEVLKLYVSEIEYLQPNLPVILKNEKKRAVAMKRIPRRIEREIKFLKMYNNFLDENFISAPFDVSEGNYTIYYSNKDTTTRSSYINEYQSVYTNTSLALLRTVEGNLMYYKDLDCRCHRVYNNSSFEEGGRFYGGEHLERKKEFRRMLLINGGETTECDYKALHPRMLYNIERIDLREDPYLMVYDNEEIRKLVKLLLNRMINAPNVHSAVGSYKNKIDDCEELKRIANKYNIGEWDLYHKIKKVHKRIEKYFNTEEGLKLQYRDSKIAENVLKYFLNKDIVCLPVHDSFIVELIYQDELLDVMHMEYEKEMGYKAIIDIKY